VINDGDADGLFLEGESAACEALEDGRCDIGALMISFFLVIFPICALSILLVSVALLFFIGAL
jgi:hypothetical protein